MEDNYCIDLCRNCKWRCVISVRNGFVSHYGCFGRKNGYREFVRDFKGTTVISHVFALDSNTGEFVSPLKEFDFIKPKKNCDETPSEDGMVFRMDDSKFYKMISSEYKACEFLAEMEMAEWSREDASN